MKPTPKLIMLAMAEKLEAESDALKSYKETAEDKIRYGNAPLTAQFVLYGIASACRTVALGLENS